ncbi:MAG: ATP-binding protein [Patescibacteria group bacterium]
MENLFTISINLINTLENIYVRECYDRLETDHRIVGIVGSRGIGKTTYLLYYLKSHYSNSDKGLYVSADDIYFSAHKLVDLVDEFIKERDGELICIDEIHRYPNWVQELKNIYDRYPKFRVIFSGSSSINLIKQTYDLSRRAVLKAMYGFSFREYLEFTTSTKYPILSIDEIVQNRTLSMNGIRDIPGLIGKYKQYLKTGYYPLNFAFSDDMDTYEALLGLVDKTIYVDIATYYLLKTSTLNVFKQILYFIHTSKPSIINPSKLANSLGKDNKDIAGYLDMLNDTGLLRYLLINKSGYALIRNTKKIYLNNPNLSYALQFDTGKLVEIGALRELFVISHLDNAGYKVFYSKRGDIIVGKYVFEIGGKNKDAHQINSIENSYLLKDDVLLGGTRTIPIYLLGFLY